MYVQVLLIRMHRRALGVPQPCRLSCQSGINQGAAQRLESRGKSQRLKFSQASASETQSKWLVQKGGSEGEGGLPDSSLTLPWLLLKKKDNMVLQNKCCFLLFFAYIQVIVST